MGVALCNGKKKKLRIFTYPLNGFRNVRENLYSWSFDIITGRYYERCRKQKVITEFYWGQREFGHV